MAFLIARLGERSTWAGIGILLSLAGVHFAPETWQAVINAGMALAALAAVLTRTTPAAPEPSPAPAVIAPPPPDAPSTLATSPNAGGGAG